MTEFVPYGKTPRLFRDVIVTEKIDGTNGQVYVDPDGNVFAGSRKRWVVPGDDNFGFAAWVYDHADLLADALGEGRHWGEWWGHGIQRGYGLDKGDKRFSLFAPDRYEPDRIAGIRGLSTVPVLYRGPLTTEVVEGQLERLSRVGSLAAPGYDRPEGVIVFHTAARQVFKAMLEGDDRPKGQAA